MSERQFFAKLRDILAFLYPEEISARRVVQDAGIDVNKVSIHPQAINTWNAILVQAQKEKKTASLMQVTCGEYPDNGELSKAWHEYLGALEKERVNASLIGLSNNSKSKVKETGVTRPVTLSPKDKKRFWETLPGVLIGVAAIITSIGGLLVIANQAGLFSSPGSLTPAATIISVPTPTNDEVTVIETLPVKPSATYSSSNSLNEAPFVINNTESSINVRKGPSTSYDVIGELEAGKRFDITGKNEDNTWLQVDFIGVKGWVFRGLVTTTASLDTIPTALDFPKLPTVTPITAASVIDTLKEELVKSGYVYNWPTGSAEVTTIEEGKSSNLVIKYRHAKDNKEGILEGEVLQNNNASWIYRGHWKQDNGYGDFELTFQSNFTVATGKWYLANEPTKPHLHCLLSKRVNFNQCPSE